MLAHIDREHNPGGEIRAVRRQTATSGINPAGSSRALRLDPLSLPIRFERARQPCRRRRAAHRTSSRTRRAAPCPARHADGGQPSGIRLSRRGAARPRRRPDAGAGSSRSVVDDPALRQLRPPTRSPPPGRCGATSSRCRSCRRTSRLRTGGGGGAAARRRFGARRSEDPWCGGARGDLLDTGVTSHRGEREIIARERSAARRETSLPASPRPRAHPQTAAAPRRGWT